MKPKPLKSFKRCDLCQWEGFSLRSYCTQTSQHPKYNWQTRCYGNLKTILPTEAKDLRFQVQLARGKIGKLEMRLPAAERNVEYARQSMEHYQRKYDATRVKYEAKLKRVDEMKQKIAKLLEAEHAHTSTGVSD